jgi:predicted nucleotidyltransferase
MKTQNIEVPKKRIAYFCQHWHIAKLSLFGSVLRNDFRPESDIDVWSNFNLDIFLDFSKLHQIQEELSSILVNRQIDLVTPKSLNHRIRDLILAEAEVYYVAEG